VRLQARDSNKTKFEEELGKLTGPLNAALQGSMATSRIARTPYSFQDLIHYGTCPFLEIIFHISQKSEKIRITSSMLNSFVILETPNIRKGYCFPS